jgi:hypothetical protein
MYDQFARRFGLHVFMHFLIARCLCTPILHKAPQRLGVLQVQNVARRAVSRPVITLSQSSQKERLSGTHNQLLPSSRQGAHQ